MAKKLIDHLEGLDQIILSAEGDAAEKIEENLILIRMRKVLIALIEWDNHWPRNVVYTTEEYEAHIKQMMMIIGASKIVSGFDPDTANAG